MARAAETLTISLPKVRTKRIKEARDEAKKEIDAYRAQKEQEFKKFEAEVGLPLLAPMDPDPFPYCSPWGSFGNDLTSGIAAP